ncbi:MAG: twin-arginine translocase TatA/TatE family subunit [Scytonema sp. PMC 1069.18]|nr:twin-arginine translocase TatA/TatE family subunit [Scytonema sp. PMC 1069.18]MEC4882416.1 twin-arginine translocase TatA/TatE family subunit [Scytonema sp. PMC 1070.18]
MFGLGWPEIAIIGLVAIVIFGPKKIPELGSALGKTLRGFKEELSNSGEDTTSEQKEVRNKEETQE